MTREKREKLYKQIEPSIYLWIQKIGSFYYWYHIDYMCIEIARTYNCSPGFVRKVFLRLKKDKSFKNWLLNFENNF